MIAPLDNGVNDKGLGGEQNIVFDTIAGVVFLQISYNVGSVFDFHNIKVRAETRRSLPSVIKKYYFLRSAFNSSI